MIAFENVSKIFDGQKVLDNISFTIPKGGKAVLYGPSGSGKSTILRLIAGLEKPDSGFVTGNEGRISLVFQDDGLFEELSCFENISYGLPYSAASKNKRNAEALFWAEIFQCSAYLDQKTSTVSGGQRKRIALARAFMKDPEIVLLDESFNSLDEVLKQELMDVIISLWEKRRFTLICVTHSYEEMIRLNAAVYQMKNGKILAHSSFDSLYLNPRDIYDAQSFGLFGMNIFPGGWLNRDGWAGIYPFDCSVKHRNNWVAFEGRCISQRDLGFRHLSVYSCKGRNICILGSVKERSDLIYLNPKKIYFFDDEGNCIDGPDNH